MSVQLEEPGAPAGRDDLLTQGVVDLVSHLVRATQGDACAVVVDVQISDAHDGDPSLEAFVEAARGLVQSYVLESQQGIGPVNVVVSRTSQEGDRQLTLNFLAGTTGSFARGATYDLREVSA